MLRSKPKIDAEEDERSYGLLILAIIGLCVAIMLLLGAWEEIVRLLI